MDFNMLSGIIGIIISFIASWILIAKFNFSSKEDLRKKYDFAKNLLTEIEDEEHPYVKELGYQALAGSKVIKTNEIEHLLSLPDPGQCLRDFISSKDFFENLENDKKFKLIFKKSYKSKKCRNIKKLILMFLYYLSFLLIFSPLILSRFYSQELTETIIQSILFFPIFSFLAGFSLISYGKYIAANRLYNTQQTHTPNEISSEETTK